MKETIFSYNRIGKIVELHRINLLMKKQFTISFLCFILIFLGHLNNTSLLAQTTTDAGAESSKSDAKDNFSYGDWKAAMKEYEDLMVAEPDNPKYNYRAGICYLQTYINKKKAIEYLEKAVEVGSTEKDVRFMLAKAYHLTNQFDKAIAKYKLAIEHSNDEYLSERAKLYMEMCETAKKLIKNPIQNIEIKNLGEDINSPEPDFVPYVQQDQEELYFTSKRNKGNQGYLAWDGLYTEDIFVCKDKNGEWSKARSIGGAVGTSHDDEIVGLTPAGDMMFIDFFDFETEDEILASEKVGKQFKQPFHLNENINRKGSKQISACIDPVTKNLYFASDMEGGKGGLDIYTAKMLPTGQWGIPEPVEELNTPWDEAFPHVTADGSKMYFASEGHGSMGGFDVFRCVKDPLSGKFVHIENIGYPLNTSDNNFHISYDKTGRNAYFSMYREEDSFGDLDIYEVTFLDIEPRITIVTGSLYEEIPIDYNEYEDFLFLEKNGETKKFTTDYVPDTLSQWKVVNRNRVPKKPGFKYSAILSFEKNGEIKKFSADNLPDDIDSYTFKDVEVKIFPDKNAKPPPKDGPKIHKKTITTANIKVYPKGSDVLYGEYASNPKNGRFVMALPEGEYHVVIESDHHKKADIPFRVMGKSSYSQMIKQGFKLEPLKEKKAIYYKDLLKKK